jgi:hypothetical protein
MAGGDETSRHVCADKPPDAGNDDFH